MVLGNYYPATNSSGENISAKNTAVNPPVQDEDNPGALTWMLFVGIEPIDSEAGYIIATVDEQGRRDEN